MTTATNKPTISILTHCINFNLHPKLLKPYDHLNQEMSKITPTSTKTSLKITFNSCRTSQRNKNIPIKPFPDHSKIKEDGLKYFSRQAIRCEIMGSVDARKSTINPMHCSRSRSSSHYATYAQETKIQAVFTPRPGTSPDSYCDSFHVISSLITCMAFFSLRYFILEQMTRYIIHLRSSINNFWLTLYASDLVSSIVCSYNIIGYKVMFVTNTLFIFFCTHTSAFKGSNSHRGNEQGLLPHILEATKTREQRKITLDKLERSCRLILEDILYTIDAQKIEAACIVLGVAVSWRVLYGLFLYVLHRFYSMKDRE